MQCHCHHGEQMYPDIRTRFLPHRSFFRAAQRICSRSAPEDVTVNVSTVPSIAPSPSSTVP